MDLQIKQNTMHEKSRINILIIANHILELFTLISIGKLLEVHTKRRYEFTLLVKPRVAKRMPERIKNLFTDIIVVEFPTNPLFVNVRNIRGLFRVIYYIFFKEIKDTLKFKQETRKLHRKTYDITLVSSYREYFTNVLLKSLRSKTLIAVRNNDPKMEEKNERKKNLVPFVANIFNFFFGYSTMKYRWHPLYDNVFSSEFKKWSYKKIIYIKYNNKPEIEVKSKKEVYLPFPFLSSLFFDDSKKMQQKNILVVGERAPIVPEWNYGTSPISKDNPCQKAYDAFLDYIRKGFSEYKLYFMPRKEYTDMSVLDLHGFEIIDDSVSMEELFATKSFEKVISVKSTASKVASCFGYPSYAIFPYLKLAPETNKHFENFFANSPNVEMVQDLEDLKKDVRVSTLDAGVVASIYSEVILDN